MDSSGSTTSTPTAIARVKQGTEDAQKGISALVKRASEDAKLFIDKANEMLAKSEELQLTIADLRIEKDKVMEEDNDNFFLRDFFDDLKETMGKLMGMFDQLSAEQQETVLGINEWVENIVESIDAQNEYIKSLATTSQAQKESAEYARIFGDEVEKILETQREATSVAGEKAAADQNVAKAEESIATAAGDATDAVYKMIEAEKEFTGIQSDGVDKAFSDMAKDSVGSLEEIQSGVTDLGDAVESQATESVEAVKESMKDVLNLYGEMAKAVIDAVPDDLPDWDWGPVVSQIYDVINAASAVYSTSLDQFIDDMANVTDNGIITYANHLADSLIDVARRQSEVGNIIYDSMEHARAFTTELQAMADECERTGTAGQHMTDALSQMQSGKESYEGTGVHKLLNGLYRDLNYARTETTLAMREMVESIQSSASGFVDPITSKISEMVNTSKGFIGGLATDFQNVFSELGTIASPVVNQITEGLRSLASVGESAMSGLDSALSGTVNVAKSAGSALSTAFSGVKTVLGVITSSIQSITNSIGKMASTIGTGLKNAGSSMANFAKKTAQAASNMKLFGKNTNSSNNNMKQIVKNVLRYGFGIRSLFVLFNKLRNAIKEGIGYLEDADDAFKSTITSFRDQLTMLKASVGAAFQPILETAIPIINKLIESLSSAINVMGEFFAKLSGKDTYKKVVGLNYSDSSENDSNLKKQENAKKKQLQDQINDRKKALQKQKEAEKKALEDQRDAEKKALEDQKKAYEDQQKYDKNWEQYEADMEEYYKKLNESQDKYLSGLDEMARFNEEEEPEMPTLEGVDDDLGDMFDTDPIDDAYDKLLDDLEDKYDNLQDQLDDELDSLLDDLESEYSTKIPQVIYETVQVDDTISDLVDKLKEAWENADFTEIGRMLGERLKDALENIDWDSLKETGQRIARSLATLINGFVETPELGRTIGQSIANAINTGVSVFQEFFDTTHFDSIGAFVRDGIIRALIGIDWPAVSELGSTIGTDYAQFLNGLFSPDENGDTIGKALGTAASGVCNALIGYINGFWSELTDTEIGYNFGVFLNTALPDIDWETCDEAFTTMAENIASNLGTFIETTKWDGVGSAISSGINTGIHTAKTLLEETPFLELGEAVAEMLKKMLEQRSEFKKNDASGNYVSVISGGIDWTGLGESIRDGFQSAIDFVTGLFGGQNGLKLSDFITAFETLLKGVFGTDEKGGIDWEGFGEDVKTGINATIDKAAELITSIPFGTIVSALTEFFKGVLGGGDKEGIHWGDLGEAISKGIVNACDAIVQFLNSDEINEVTDDFKEFFLAFDWYKVGKACLEAFITGLLAVDDVVQETVNGLGDKALRAIFGDDLVDKASGLAQNGYDNSFGKWNAESDALLGGHYETRYLGGILPYQVWVQDNIKAAEEEVNSYDAEENVAKPLLEKTSKAINEKAKDETFSWESDSKNTYEQAITDEFVDAGTNAVEEAAPEVVSQYAADLANEEVHIGGDEETENKFQTSLNEAFEAAGKEAAEAAVESAVTNIESGITEAEVTIAAEEGEENMFTRLYDLFEKAGEQDGTAFVDKVEANIIEGLTSSELASSIEGLQLWNDIDDTMKNAGETAGNNFADGIVSAFSGLADSLKNTLNESISVLNNFVQRVTEAAQQVANRTADMNGYANSSPSWSYPNISSASIPKLATGAVIPPNAPFLALLGDQRSGTNVEAPLDTIKQAIREELGNLTGVSGGDITIRVPISIDGKQVTEAVAKHAKQKKQMTGKNPLTAF